MKGKMIVILLVLMLINTILVFAWSLPAIIKGTIYESDGVTQVPNGTAYLITNNDTGQTFSGTTYATPPYFNNTGYYSKSVDGSGDNNTFMNNTFIIEASKDGQYGSTTVIASAGDIKLDVDVILNPPCVDEDEDGYSLDGGGECCGPTHDQTCEAEADCNDTDADINPGATEICNGIDDDCDGIIDEGCNEFNITLVTGWNLISLPLTPTNLSIDAVIQGCNYTRIWEFQQEQSWKSTDTGLTDMNIEHGYWVDRIGLSGNCTILIFGTLSNLTIINVSTPWTLVGYPSLNPRLITDLISGTLYNRIWEFQLDQSWKSADTGLINFTPGKGYWIDSSTTGSYNVSN